jgi:hypothetical protein
MASSPLGSVGFAEDGALVWALPDAVGEVFLLPQLTRGVGVSALFLDRGRPGYLRHLRLRRERDVVVVEQLQTRAFTSGAPDPSVDDSFARATLALLPVKGRGDGVTEVDVTGFAKADLVGIAETLAQAGCKDAKLDPERAYIREAETYSHAGGLELTADLTITDLPETVAEVLPDRHTATVTQRLTLLPLPTGFTPRRAVTGSGHMPQFFQDYSLPQDQSPESGWLPRFRASADRPIVFSADPVIPEPFRQAVLDGANWWQAAFAQAGQAGAFKAELRAPETDPAQAGVNPVWWVHRLDRGWSIGYGPADPRTGEIVKGNVQLGSQRLHQLTLLGEALLTPYGRPDEGERLAAIHDFTLARLRLLAAHEVGHALGLTHNFATHTQLAPSVMDYPFPDIRQDDRGEIVLSRAYATGLGDWDYLAIAIAYGDDATSADALARSRGLGYLSDEDANEAGSATPSAAPWLVPGDPLAGLARLMAVRARALADFGPGACPAGAPAHDLEERYLNLHLLHRHQAAGVARLLGGVDYPYRTAGEQTQSFPAPPDRQAEALDALFGLLKPDFLAVPHHVTPLLLPPAADRRRTAADLQAGRMGRVFDPVAAAGVAARLVTDLIFEPQRLNRLAAARKPAPRVKALVGGALGAIGAQALPVPAEARRAVLASALAALKSGQLESHAEAGLTESLTVAALYMPGPEGQILDKALKGKPTGLDQAPEVPAGSPW